MGELVKKRVVSWSENAARQLEANDPRLDLMHRSIGGVSVTMLMDRKTKAISVQLEADDAQWDMLVDPSEALEVYNHPYPYGFARGLELIS